MEHNPDIWVQHFLRGLATFGVVTKACEHAGIPPSVAYDYRKRDADFAASWKLALDEATDVLEIEARRRAVEGVDEPVFYQGGEVGVVRKYSDSLLTLLLKGRRKEVFADRVEHTGADGGPVMTDDTARATRIAHLVELARQRKIADDNSDLA